MTKQDPDRMISDAVDAVLETMFFSAVLGPAEPETGGEVLEALVRFRGRQSGTLAVCISERSSRLLAASFLGEDEETLTDSQPGQMVRELANMLCGSLVSKLGTEESFDLASPELISSGSNTGLDSIAPPTARQSFELEGGILTVTMNLDTPQ